ncbi:PIG-X [Collybia nuda]|uniref:Protein PBN1 n=1 Tax=Collybia nuda TaxID=64659 RepID=A0A9P5Y4Y8_9AGAR|nr:PIG-X [Collybia nuda]
MASLISSVSPKDGFHPISTTAIYLPKFNPLCTLHLHFSLQPLIFVDPYELAHHEEFYTFKHWGTSNLELPVTAVDEGGSAVLLNVDVPEGAREVEVRVPLHLRYGDPAQTSSSGHHSVEMAWPTGFLVCPLDASIHTSSPINLPAEVFSLFDLKTTSIIDISPNGTHPFDTVRVPTGNPADVGFVEFGTMFTILFSFFYLLRAALATARRMNKSSGIKRD